MAQLLRANKPTTLVCTGNLDHEMEWDSDEMLFLIEYDEKIIKELENDGYRMHPLVPEIIVWGKQLDFSTTFIARKEDFDELEMF
jgi:hypothetical protein